MENLCHNVRYWMGTLNEKLRMTNDECQVVKFVGPSKNPHATSKRSRTPLAWTQRRYR